MLKQLEELSSALQEQHQDDKGARQGAKASMRPRLPLNRSEGRKRAGQPLTETVLSDLRRRRQLGESYSALAADLNQRGLRGPHGARWYTSSVRTLLQC
jgi:hypothetical protein